MPWPSELVAQAAQTNLAGTQHNWPIVYDVARRWEMDSPLCLVGIIGTIATETASTFAPVREAYYLATDAQRWAWYSDTSKHAPYAGGPQYHGRGFVQTTHDYNYQKVKDYTGVDVVGNPDLLLTNPRLAAEALCIYFAGRNICSIAERRDWLGVRRAVYGGTDQAGATRMANIARALGV